MSSSHTIRVAKRNMLVFLTICGLFSTAHTNELSSSSNKTVNGSGSVSKLSEIVMNNFVATTPRIDVTEKKAPSR